MNNKFKLGYTKAVVLLAILLSIAVTSMNCVSFVISFFNVRIHQDILVSISYSIPFIVFFFIIKYQIKKQKLSFKIYNEPYSLKIYPLMLLMMISGIFITEELYLILPKNIPFFEELYKKVENSLVQQIDNPDSLIFSIIILAPIFEELFFRGFLLNGLIKNNIYPIKAIIFTSFLFGITHMNPWQFIGGCIIGSVFGIVFFCTRSIYNCIFLHSINNILATCVVLNKNYLIEHYNYHNYIYNNIIQSDYLTLLLFVIILCISTKILIEETEEKWKCWYK